MTEEKNNNEVLNFSFDNLMILGIFGNYMYIRGNIDVLYGRPCIIKIKKSLFFKTQKEWMNEKQKLCEEMKCFCGINITNTDDYKEVEEAEILEFDDGISRNRELTTEELEKSIKVKVFLANTLNPECELD
jgi:hypothetical protein